MMMDKYLLWNNVQPGEVVADGFRDRKAPEAPGLYSLYELVDTDSNTHLGFEWVKQDGVSDEKLVRQTF